jgi:anthranilate synthase/aminodeoxychorismate synthase-like glutamine amidotransferase
VRPGLAYWTHEAGEHVTPRVVLVDHHDSYTWNLVHLVAGVTGALPTVVQHDEVDARDLLDGRFTHVVLSPGPGTPHDEHDFAVGREVLLDGRLPTLGVCLGMQGLVTTYGGRVEQVEPAHGEPATVRHDGDPMFAGVPSPFTAVRYHSLAAVQVPEVLVETAWCDGPGGEVGGEVVMAVAHRERPLWGVQFHPESVLSEHGARLVSTFLDAAEARTRARV